MLNHNGLDSPHSESIAFRGEICESCGQVHLSFIKGSGEAFVITGNEDDLEQLLHVIYTLRVNLIVLKHQIRQDKLSTVKEAEGLLGIQGGMENATP